MLFLLPSQTELLALAADVVGNWDPCNTSDAQREEVVLAGRAAAVAIREFCASRGVEQATEFDLSHFNRDVQTSAAPTGDIDLNSLWAQLAKDIRSGHFDEETMAPSVHNLLTGIALRCLQVSNPAYFKTSNV
jgi:hypothetical protein